ncbi:MAG: hypothetical protein AAF593_09445 [Planctomycetota bacterium]
MNESAPEPAEIKPATPSPAWLERRGPAGLVLLAIVASGAALRLYRIGVLPLWRDEGATVRFARRTFAELWGPRAVLETNPPGYYSLQRLWLVFGESEEALRSLSAVLGIASIGLTYWLAAGLADPAVRRRTGLLAAALFAVAAIQIEYAQEARAYGMMTTLALGAMVSLSVLLRHPAAAYHPWWRRRTGEALLDRKAWPRMRWVWLSYVVSSLLMLYSHNTAVVPMACIQVVAFVWWVTAGRRRAGFFWNWLTANGLVLLGWVWWVPRIMGQAQGQLQKDWWIPEATWRSVWAAFEQIYLFAHLGRVSGIATLLGLAVMVLGVFAWRRKPLPLWLCLGFGVGGVLLLFGLSHWRPMFLTRAVIWTAPAMCVLMAAGLMWLRPVGLRLSVAGVLLLLSVKNVHSSYALIEKAPWDEAAAYMREQDEAGDVVLFIWEPHDTAFDYYYPEAESPADRLGLVNEVSAEFDASAPMPYFITLERWPYDRLDELMARYDTVWLVTSRRLSKWEAQTAVLGTAHSEAKFGRILIREYRSVERDQTP